MWWLNGNAPDFYGAEDPGSNPASPTMILMGCRIFVNNVENLKAERETYPRGKRKNEKEKNFSDNNFFLFF